MARGRAVGAAAFLIWLLAGCHRHPVLPPSLPRPPVVELVRQENLKPGQKLQVGRGKPVEAASVLYFRSSLEMFSEKGFPNCAIDYGDGGRNQYAQIISTGSAEFAAVVPWGYRWPPKRAKCELTLVTHEGVFAKEWILKPLPVPSRTLKRPGPNPDIASFHTTSPGGPAIAFKLRKPPLAGWRLTAILEETSYNNDLNWQIVFGEPCAIPFAADQDAVHLTWWLERPFEKKGVLRLDGCRLEASMGTIFLDIDRAAKVMIPGRGTVTIPKQSVRAIRRRHGSSHWFSVMVSASWTPSSVKPTKPWNGAHVMTGIGGFGGPASDSTVVSLSYAGPDLTEFGLSDITVDSPYQIDRKPKPWPKSTTTVKPGPLPPLWIRYDCTWSKRGPRHEADVPIDSKD